MKRFFKKASLLLVVLCLVAGSILPSFAASYDDGWYSVEFYDTDNIGEYNCTVWLRTDSLSIFKDDYSESWIVVEQFDWIDGYDCSWDHESTILYIPYNQEVSTSGTIDDMDAYDEPYSTKNNSLFMFYNTYGYDVDYLQRIRTFGDFTVSGSTLMLTVYKNRGSDFDIYE